VFPVVRRSTQRALYYYRPTAARCWAQLRAAFSVG
jgi:hypothetical protein